MNVDHSQRERIPSRSGIWVDAGVTVVVQMCLPARAYPRTRFACACPFSFHEMGETTSP